MAKRTITVPPARLQELFTYDYDAGLLYWRVNRRRARAGTPAGCIPKGRTRRHITIDNVSMTYAPAVWCFVHGEWPNGEIDHIDCDPLNDKVTNLRVATRSQQTANTKLRADNASGFKGVYFDGSKREKKWRAQIRCGDALTHLGYFKTPEEAHAAYSEAAMKAFGEFARTA